MSTSLFMSKTAKVAQALSNRTKVPVILINGISCTDGEKLYLDMRLGEYEGELKTYYEGVVDHETAHILFSQFTNPKANNVLKDEKAISIWNNKKYYGAFQNFEDMRVNRMMCQAYPGSLENISISDETSLLFHEENFDYQRNKFSYKELERACLYLRCLAFDNFQYLLKRYFDKDIFIQKYFKSFWKKRASRFFQCTDTKQTLYFVKDFVDDFYKELSKYFDKPKEEKKEKEKEKEKDKEDNKKENENTSEKSDEQNEEQEEEENSDSEQKQSSIDKDDEDDEEDVDDEDVKDDNDEDEDDEEDVDDKDEDEDEDDSEEQSDDEKLGSDNDEGEELDEDDVDEIIEDTFNGENEDDEDDEEDVVEEREEDFISMLFERAKFNEKYNEEKDEKNYARDIFDANDELKKDDLIMDMSNYSEVRKLCIENYSMRNAFNSKGILRNVYVSCTENSNIAFKRKYESIFKTLNKVQLSNFLRIFEQKLFSRSLVFEYEDPNEGEYNISEILRMGTLPNYKSRFPFLNTTESEARSISCYILVDVSGSMYGTKVHKATEIVIALADSFKRLNIKFEVSAHNTAFSKGGYYNSEKQIGRTCNTCVYVLKKFDNAYNYNLSMIPLLIGGANTDGASMEYCADILSRRNEDRRIMFYICDGMPTGYASHTAGIKHMQHIANTMRINNMEFYGIGIDTELQEIFGDEISCNVNSFNLIRDLSRIITSKI